MMGFTTHLHKAPEGSKLSSKTDQHMLYYHKLGTKQKSDKVIFGQFPMKKTWSCKGYVTMMTDFLLLMQL